jgi:hypothetical protein
MKKLSLKNNGREKQVKVLCEKWGGKQGEP